MTTIKQTPDPKNLPRMSKAKKKRFDAFTDEDVEYSDTPELDAEFWAKAEMREPYQKAAVTMRVDKDTLDYFKGANPKGYTARMATFSLNETSVLSGTVQAVLGSSRQ